MAENFQGDRHRPTGVHRLLSALTAGNIVTVALQVFRGKSDDYITTSLQSYLWFFLCFLGACVLGGLGYLLGQSLGLTDKALVIFAGLFALPLLAYGRGRKTATGGILSRLIFNQLINRTESKENVQQQIFPRTWIYLRAELLFWLILIGLYLGFVFILGLFAGLFFSSFRQGDILDFLIRENNFSGSTVLTWIAIIALILLFYLGIILFFSYFVARLWLFDVIIALEEVTAIQALRRSWQLTRTQGREALAVALISGSMLVPPLILCGFLSIFGFLSVLFLIVLAFPLYQSVKAVNYYDLRSRNEGLTFDLEIVTTNPQQYLQRVILQTPESIELDLALGGIGSRALAWVIDQILLWVGIFLFWYFGSVFYLTILLPILTNAFTTFSSGDLDQWVEAIASLSTFALTNSYFIAFETLNKGQTPGKKLAKIRVVRDTGQPVGLKESSIRSLLGTVDVCFFFVGVLLIGITKSEKRLGDLVAGTLVIQNQQGGQPIPDRFEFSPQTAQIAETLMDRTNLNVLTPDQFLTLRDFLGYRSHLAVGMRSQITIKLASQIRHLLGSKTQSLVSDVDDLELVKATYLACQQAK
ncbi:MAG: RDD family protein [Acaryochloridaceae cyanobacterium CSU_3_4]|nr:RDD family protein [Acaryochloridaceae cyanobacterium CSU_3_4]